MKKLLVVLALTSSGITYSKKQPKKTKATDVCYTDCLSKKGCRYDCKSFITPCKNCTRRQRKDCKKECGQ